MARRVFEIDGFATDGAYPLGYFDCSEVGMNTQVKVAFTEGARVDLRFDKNRGKYMIEVEEIDMLDHVEPA